MKRETYLTIRELFRKKMSFGSVGTILIVIRASPQIFGALLPSKKLVANNTTILYIMCAPVNNEVSPSSNMISPEFI